MTDMEAQRRWEGLSDVVKEEGGVGGRWMGGWCYI